MHQILKVANSDGGFLTGLATLLGLATVYELGVVWASFDDFGSAGTVEPAYWHPVRGWVETAMQAAFGSRSALRGLAG